MRAVMVSRVEPKARLPASNTAGKLWRSQSAEAWKQSSWAEPAPFSISFVRVPYDVEAELAHAREVGAPEYDGYESELRRGIYRGSMAEYADDAALDTYYHDVLVR